jgi:O-antigen ligase
LCKTAQTPRGRPSECSRNNNNLTPRPRRDKFLSLRPATVGLNSPEESDYTSDQGAGQRAPGLRGAEPNLLDKAVRNEVDCESLTSPETDLRTFQRRRQILFGLSSIVFVTALLLGGAGEDYPWMDCIIQSASVVLLWFLVASGQFPAVRGAKAFPIWLSLAICAIPLLQLVPLPYGVWTSLPGRAEPAKIMALAGLPPGWRASSLDPGYTVIAAIEMLPGIAIFLACLNATREQRKGLFHLVIAVAMLSAMLGAFQRAGGAGSGLTLYDQADFRRTAGLFVNMNHQATFLLIAIHLCASLTSIRPPVAIADTLYRMLLLVAIAVLSVGILATGSRAGLFLLIPTLMISLFRFRQRSWGWRSTTSALLISVMLSIALWETSAAQYVIGRFSQGPDARTDFWSASWNAIRLYWPIGSGIGTFTRVYPTVETLGSLARSYANNAHNDYIELALEAGLPAVLLILGFFIFLIHCLILVARRNWGRGQGALGMGAFLGLSMILLHSLVDYPLRMQSIMAVFGLLCATLVASIETSSPLPTQQQSTRRRKRVRTR